MIDLFTSCYIACALWSSSDNSRDDGGDPLDDNYGPNDLAPETLAAMIKECRDFRDYVRETLGAEAAEQVDTSCGGHDFWLTRNAHGAGFWDGDWGTLGDDLTKASKTFGSCDLYVGDDGKIYAS